MLRDRRLGLVEDDPVMGEALTQCFQDEGAVVAWWQRGESALREIADFQPDLVVCDIHLPDLSGELLFTRAVEDVPRTPFLFITAFGRIDEAVRLMRQGAGDYMTKPFDVPELLDRVVRLLPSQSSGSTALLGPSRAMAAIEATLHRVARIRSTVLITGETGVGKEVCAGLLHDLGRAGFPFIPVNCAAIPLDLMESEMFGHERGAFTGAGARHIGHAERAGEGTLFLDEVGELSPAMQAKLLRLLDDRRFFRVGGSDLVPFKARVIAATNIDLEQSVAVGKFRSDLYFRLNVVPLHIPPLRERPEDIRWLLQHFLEKIGTDLEANGLEIDLSAEQAALAYYWPGNVREMRNRVEKAIALSSGRRITAGDLVPVQASRDGLLLEDSVKTAERQQIERALTLTRGEIGSAAKVLGISRTTLWKKMRALDVLVSANLRRANRADKDHSTP